MSTHRPMEGIRILDLADHTFVPAASAILSDWGAEVIKIEHITRGDAARGLGVHRPGDVPGTGVAHPGARQPRQAQPRPRPHPGRGSRHPLPARRHLRRLPHQQDAERAGEAEDRRRRHPGAQPEHHLRVGIRLRRPRSRPRRRAGTTSSATGTAAPAGSASRRPTATRCRRCPHPRTATPSAR